MKKILFTILSINLRCHLIHLQRQILPLTLQAISKPLPVISGGNNIDIDLKRLPIDIFSGAQTGSDWRNFDIHLNNCSSFINQIKLTFAGTADTADTTSLYKNLGTAQK